ncbi:MAG: hypothetical protein IKL81_02070, partial [Clostridia bacterium]|nr:hypothetical protein [Clostridia bacterium]
MKIFKRVFSVLLAILLTPLISTVAYAKSTNDVTFNSGKAYLDTGWADDEFMIAFNWTSTKKVTNYG